MRLTAVGVFIILAGTMSAHVHGQGKPADVSGTMTFSCADHDNCAGNEALASDGASYSEDADHDTFATLSKDGRLQFRFSEDGVRVVWMNLSDGTPLCSTGVHCYLDTYADPPGWAPTFGRNGGQATIVNASGSDVKNGLNSLAVGSWAYGRFVMNWDDPQTRDMRWGLTFRGSDQTLRIRRDDPCTWTIFAGDGGAPATAVLSAWPRIKRAYTEIPQATYEIPFSLTFTTCP